MFGIDIASPQRDIDLARAKAEGVEFVIVKMGGLNVTPQYVAPYYTAQIDRAVAAGLPKGHYYLIGKGQTPEQQAEYMYANLYKFDRAKDVLALDNELLDANGTLWGDADAAKFIRRLITLTGIPAHRVWHYAGARDYRAGSWPELEALGVRFWWAAYGNYPNGQTPDHEPDLQGSIPRWDVHQFTSRSKVAGYELDGNYSPHSSNILFGGEVATEAQIRTWISGYPRAWDQLCQALMWQLANKFGTVKSTPVSAILAYHVERQAGRMRTSTPPPGSFVYWDIGEFGHVGYVMNGGRVLMATRHLADEWVNSDAGWQTIDAYTRATGADYLGWSYQNGGNTVPFSTASGTAGGDITPIEEIDMPLTDADVHKIWTYALTQLSSGVSGRAADWLTNLPKQIKDTTAQVRADINYIHVSSAHSLKAIREAQAGGQPVELSDVQVAELAASLVSSVTAGLSVALDENEAAVIAAIAQLPDQVRANIKAAL